MKIRWKNYQSLEDVELEIEGFTVLVGDTNAGKSAMIRGLEDSFTARQGSDFVRTGAKFASVSVEDEEYSHRWEKGERDNRIYFGDDPNPHDKIDKTAPPQIAKAGYFALPINSAKGKSISAQFAGQAGGDIFLLGETNAVLAEVFSKLSRLDVWLKAAKGTEGDIRALSSELKIREGDLAKDKGSHAKFEGLDDAGQVLSALSDLERTVEERQSRIQVASQLLSSYSKVLDFLSVGDQVSLVALPASGEREIPTRLQTVQKAKDYHLAYGRVMGLLNVEEPLREVNVPEVSTQRVTLLREAERLYDSHLALSKYPESVNFFLPELEFNANLLVLAGRLMEAHQKLPAGEFSLPDTAWSLSDTGSLRSAEEFTQALAKLDTAASVLETERQDTEAMIQKTHQEFQALKQELGVCPLCEREYH